MASNDTGGSFTLGFLVGGIIGALIGILVAPKSGQETRADLSERSELWRTRAEELAAQLRERVGPAVEEVRGRVGPAVESARERVGPMVEQVTSRVRTQFGAAETDRSGEVESDTAEGDGTTQKGEQEAKADTGQ